MSEPVVGAAWRKRMQDLSRNAGRPHSPLFAPLLFGVAAQIESIAPAAMAHDGTRLRKNVGELQRALGMDAVVCSVPSAMEVEALGVPVDDAWPPRPAGVLSAALAEEIDAARLAALPRVGASLDAVRQWQADASAPVIVAALTGPHTFLGQLRDAGAALGNDAGYDFVGRVLAAFARLYAEAGVHVLQWHETALPDEAGVELWKGALGTAGNVARFHRVPPLLVVESAAAELSWPAQAVACPTHAQHAGAMPRAHGRAWPADATQWPALPGDAASERIVTTTAEVRADIAVLVEQVKRVRG